jgi:hypothetical protein
MSRLASMCRAWASSSVDTASSGACRRNLSAQSVRTCSVTTQLRAETTGTRCLQPGRSTLVNGTTLTRSRAVNSRWKRDDTTSAGRSVPRAAPRTGAKSTNHSRPGSIGGSLTRSLQSTRRRPARRPLRARPLRRDIPPIPADWFRGSGGQPRLRWLGNAPRPVGARSRRRERRRIPHARSAGPLCASRHSHAARPGHTRRKRSVKRSRCHRGFAEGGFR